MEKIDVCGMGNALVDTVYNVENSFLGENSIQKGVMTLIDERRYLELQDVLKNKEVGRTSGGSAANTMIALSQLGGSGYYSCKVASDDDGDFYIRDLSSVGVKTTSGPRESGKTGRCMVMVTRDEERTMNTFLGITEQFSVKELNQNAIKRASYLYIEGYLAASPSALLAAVQASQIAKNSGVKRALTFSDPNMVKFFGEGIDAIIDQKIDLIFCNQEEAGCYADSDDLNQAIQKLKLVANSFVITLGKKGALVFDGTGVAEIAGCEVKAIDTVGAGDMFAGAFLYGMTHGRSFASSASLACRASSEVVAVYGARLSTKKLKSLLEEL